VGFRRKLFNHACVEALEDRRCSALRQSNGFDGNVFRRAGLTQPVATRARSAGAFQFGKKAPVARISDDVFSVQWTAGLRRSATGVILLQRRADDGVRLLLNGNDRE